MSGPERFKVPVGIFIMLRQDDKVLLQLRQNCSFSGHWGFVGGHLHGKKAIFKINSGISFYEDILFTGESTGRISYESKREKGRWHDKFISLMGKKKHSANYAPSTMNMRHNFGDIP